MGKWDLSAISYILPLHIEVGNKQSNKLGYKLGYKLVVMLVVKLVVKLVTKPWYKLHK